LFNSFLNSLLFIAGNISHGFVRGKNELAEPRPLRPLLIGTPPRKGELRKKKCTVSDGQKVSSVVN
jgi:hypothetical protein